jgi:8-oxo-dGTP pyrophosphatase MutT (NUDIX family)
MNDKQEQRIVVSGVLESSKGVLLAQRPITKKIAPGIYHLPGGHVEFGEDPEASLRREFQEEFSLDVRINGVVRIFSYVRGDVHFVEITYKVSSSSLPDVITFDEKETESVEWIDAEQMRQYLPEGDHDRITLEEYFKEKK